MFARAGLRQRLRVCACVRARGLGARARVAARVKLGFDRAFRPHAVAESHRNVSSSQETLESRLSHDCILAKSLQVLLPLLRFAVGSSLLVRL